MKSELRKGERRRSSKIEQFDFSKFEKFGHPRDRSEYRLAGHGRGTVGCAVTSWWRRCGRDHEPGRHVTAVGILMTAEPEVKEARPARVHRQGLEKGVAFATDHSHTRGFASQEFLTTRPKHGSGSTRQRLVEGRVPGHTQALLREPDEEDDVAAHRLAQLRDERPVPPSPAAWPRRTARTRRADLVLAHRPRSRMSSMDHRSTWRDPVAPPCRRECRRREMRARGPSPPS